MIEFAYSSVIFMAHFAMYFDDFTRENIRPNIADFEQFFPWVSAAKNRYIVITYYIINYIDHGGWGGSMEGGSMSLSYKVLVKAG